QGRAGGRVDMLRHGPGSAGAETIDERALLAGKGDGSAQHGLAPRARRGWRRGLRRALAEEADFGTPFAFAPVLFGAGAIIYFLLPWEPAWFAILVPAALAVAGRMLAGFLRLPWMAMLLLALGLACAKLQTDRLDTP